MFQVMKNNESLFVKDNAEGLNRTQTENYGLLFGISLKFYKYLY